MSSRSYDNTINLHPPYPTGIVPRQSEPLYPPEVDASKLTGCSLPISNGGVVNSIMGGIIPAVPKKSHSHYFKDISKYDLIDVYRVLDLFSVTDPCIQHAVKKLLVAGCRGVKSTDKDIQEAIDSLKRFQDMRKEDGKE